MGQFEYLHSYNPILGIESIEYSSVDPKERANDLINLVDSDLDEIAVILEDIRDHAIYFEERGKMNKAHFWKEVHRFIICHFLMLPEETIKEKADYRKRKNII